MHNPTVTKAVCWCLKIKKPRKQYGFSHCFPNLVETHLFIYLALNHLCYCVFPLGTGSLYSGLEFIVYTTLASDLQSSRILLHLTCSSRLNNMYYHALLCIIYFFILFFIMKTQSPTFQFLRSLQ